MEIIVGYVSTAGNSTYFYYEFNFRSLIAFLSPPWRLFPECARQTPAGSRDPRPAEQTPPSLIDWWGSNRGWAATIGAVSAASRRSYWGCWKRAVVLGSAHGGEKSSFSQLGCCSRELRSRIFEEEEGQTGVAFITDAISRAISALQSRLRGWRCWRGMSSCTPWHCRGKHPRNPFLSPRAMCCEWPPDKVGKGNITLRASNRFWFWSKGGNDD